MQLEAVEIQRAGARETAAEYRRAAKVASDPRVKREFEDIGRAYAAAARDGLPLIALTPTITAGGTSIRTRVERRWDGEKNVDVRTNYLLPNLAVCRPSAAFCFSRGVQENGSVEFIDSLGRSETYRKGVVELETGFDMPSGFVAGTSLRGSWHRTGAWSSMVPIVPPKHRPASDRFGNRVVLWEADDWTWQTPPRPPGDPALLRPLGGDVYVVEATWDLTELERLVLTGRQLSAT
jgi:hypothetical protein